MDLLSANDRAGCYPASYYAATATPLAAFAPASGDISCDVCVIGGGYTGLSCALHLAQAGYDVVLLEAQRVGFGASGRNGGQVGTGQRLDQEDLEPLVGQQQAHRLWDMSLESVALVKDLIAQHRIDAEWTDGIIHAAHRARMVPDLHSHVNHMAQHYSYTKMRSLDRHEMRQRVASPAYHGGLLDMGSGHLHPLRFALGLAGAAHKAGVRIHERSRVTDIKHSDPAVVTTAGASVTARFVAVCANGYLGGLLPKTARRVMPINNYIAATAPLDPDQAEALIAENHAVADTKFVVNYFRRSADNRLLFGGGESYGYRFPKDIAGFVRRPMTRIFPQLAKTKIDFAWGGTLAITMSRLPHLSRPSANILHAGGFSGHGVAMGTYSGQLLSEAIRGQAEKFDLMASLPTAPFPGGTALRHPLLVLAMLWYGLRDRI
ncbi:MAG: gamma-glutamylputrescine oxidase [Paracoccaceae bacterium]|jgi:gamma-glutamylputrescine oxidase